MNEQITRNEQVLVEKIRFSYPIHRIENLDEL